MKKTLLILLCVLVFAWWPAPAPAQRTQMGEMSMLLGKRNAVNLNSALSDNGIPISFNRYIVRRVVVTNASTALISSLATLGLFSSTGGSGTVATTSLLTGLTSSSKFTDLPIAATSNVLTAGTLYARNVVAHGSAATADVYIFGEPLP